MAETNITVGSPMEAADGRPIYLTKDTVFGWGAERIMSRSEAFELIERARGKTPADWLSWKHIGTALHIAGDSANGLRCLRKAVEMHRSATTLLDLAVLLETFGQFDEALALAKEGNELDPKNQFVGLLYAQARLRQGQWAEAWQPFEHYCWGKIWQVGLEQYIPHWQGEPLNGKRILILQGGGFGDNIMFMRWFMDLYRQGAKIIYACPDAMVPLLRGHPWIHKLVPTHEGPDTDELPEVDLGITKDNVAQFDYFCPIMGLALRCGATVENVGLYDGRYLQARVHQIKGGDRKKPYVGVCWAGAEKLDPRRHRSLNPSQVNRLLAVKGVNWVNLQFGVPRDGILNPEMHNWRDTAQIVAGLDLVVTVDTGVAHLAGALGTPTWVCLCALSDWKFGIGRTDSPFYKSWRLFRNESGNDGIDASLDLLIAELRRCFTSS
jgi:hypothetical protein